ncbi:MAG TPA: hypothetical protein VFQ83_08910 [Candidatus Udaeobacter sp.]|jgi:hypothetical protein|nr:hypothetical protein [Candidatus Udaeobacter sp.]
MKRASLCLLVCGLSSCLYPLTVGGPYSDHVSAGEVEQIERLLSHHPPQVEAEFWAPVRRIWFVRADRAEVTLTDGMSYVELTVSKRAGAWQIDPASIRVQYLVTS